jgi:hypothetical protein
VAIGVDVLVSAPFERSGYHWRNRSVIWGHGNLGKTVEGAQLKVVYEKIHHSFVYPEFRVRRAMLGSRSF